MPHKKKNESEKKATAVIRLHRTAMDFTRVAVNPTTFSCAQPRVFKAAARLTALEQPCSFMLRLHRTSPANRSYRDLGRGSFFWTFHGRETGIKAY